MSIMNKTPLSDVQTKWLLQVKENRAWCIAYKGSASIIHRVYINGCYTESEAAIINNSIGPRYLLYLKNITN